MQRGETKTLLYLERWVYVVTYDHFCSLLQATWKICLPFVLSPKRHFGNSELPQVSTTFHQGLRTFQRKALHFGNKQNL